MSVQGWDGVVLALQVLGLQGRDTRRFRVAAGRRAGVGLHGDGLGDRARVVCWGSDAPDEPAGSAGAV